MLADPTGWNELSGSSWLDVVGPIRPTTDHPMNDTAHDQTSLPAAAGGVDADLPNRDQSRWLT